MLKVFKGIKTIVKLAIVAFIVVVLVGIYMALNAAPSASIRASEAQGAVSDTGLGGEKPVDVSGLVAPEADDSLDDTAGEDESVDDLDADSADDVDRLFVDDNTPESEDNPSGSSSGAGITQPSGGSPSSPSAPPSVNTKQPVWHEPEYITVHHEAEYKTVHHEAVYTTVTDFYTVCNDCGFKVQGSIYPHQDATGHGRYSTDVPFPRQVLVSEAWDEQVLVKAAWDEQVLVKPGYWE